MTLPRPLSKLFPIATSALVLLTLLLTTSVKTPASERTPQDPDQTPTTRPALPSIGAHLEAKWGGLWRPGVVKNRSPQGWVLINYDKSRTYEWVEWWRLRPLGSTTDDLPHAQPNNALLQPGPPPTAPPSPPPAKESAGNPSVPSASAPAGANSRATTSPVESAPASSDAAAPPLPITSSDTPKPSPLPTSAAAWTLAPDSPDPSLQKPATQTINLQGGTRQFLETTELILPHGASPIALINYIDLKTNAVRFDRVNLLTGVPAGTLLMPTPSVPMDLSPSGQLLLSRQNENNVALRDRLDIWKLTPGAPGVPGAPNKSNSPPQHDLSFKPYVAPDAKWPATDPLWAAFVDDAHLLTLNYDGHLILWDISAPQQQQQQKQQPQKVRAVWCIALTTIPVMPAFAPAFSPGGHQLAVVDAAGIALIDPLKGKLLARLPSSTRRDQFFAFSPDGKRFAAESAGNVHVYDLATGQLTQSVLIPSNMPGGPLLFTADPDYILLHAGEYLLDINRGFVLWHYEDFPRANNPPTGQWAGRFWHLILGRPAGPTVDAPKLASAILPQPAAKQLAATLKDEDLDLIKPGVTVSVEVNIDAPEDQRQQVIQALKFKLQQNQITVADTPQPIKLVATTTLGQSQSRKYEQIGVGAQSATVTVTPHITRLAFVTPDGQTAWSNTTTASANLFLNAQPGQSAQDAANAQSQYNIPFLINSPIPTRVAKPHQPYGKSALP